MKSFNKKKRTYLDKDGPNINISGYPNAPEMPYAEHDFYDADIVTAADDADIWFLYPGATGVIVGFVTKGYCASVEWDKKKMKETTGHNTISVGLLKHAKTEI